MKTKPLVDTKDFPETNSSLLVTLRLASKVQIFQKRLSVSFSSPLTAPLNLGKKQTFVGVIAMQVGSVLAK